MYRDDGVEPVVLAPQEGLSLQVIHFPAKPIKLRTEVGGNVLSLTGKLKISLGIRQAARQLFIVLQRFRQALAPGKDLLRVFLVLPEVRLGYLLFESLEFLTSLGGVKENSAGRRRVASVRRIPFAVLQSWSVLCPLLLVGCQLSVVSNQVTGIRSQRSGPKHVVGLCLT